IIILGSLLIAYFPLSMAITDFEYDAADSPDVVFLAMENYIRDYESFGYECERLSDILEEADLYRNNDNIEFYRTASLFRNVSIKAKDAYDFQIMIIKEAEILKKHGIEVNSSDYQKIELAKEHFQHSRYENSVLLLESVDDVFSYEGSVLFEEAATDLSEVEVLFDSLEIDSNMIKTLLAKIQKAKSDQDLLGIDVLIDDVAYINESIISLKKVKYYIEYFNNQSISIKKLNDIFQEILYYSENGKYSRIGSLEKDADLLYESAQEYQSEYMKMVQLLEEIAPASNNGKITEFNLSLSATYSSYLDSEFEQASQGLEKLSQEITIYKSEQIAFSAVEKENKSLIELLTDNVEYILVVFLISIIVGLIFSNRISEYVRQKKIINYTKEREDLMEYVKKNQKDYFDNKIISRKEYEINRETYQNRIVDLTRNLALLNDRVKNKKEIE
ncbi:hypothetical protein JXC34_00120, partial [Candidatus Woesearchaeota archaeon]|nr:hypothetical protein [Candidatus Woesearchaeota archaeon]